MTDSTNEEVKTETPVAATAAKAPEVQKEDKKKSSNNNSYGGGQGRDNRNDRSDEPKPEGYLE